VRGEGDRDGVVVGEERTEGAKAEGDRRKRRHAAQAALGNKAATTEAEDRARGGGEDDSSTLHCTIYRLASFCPFAGVQRPIFSHSETHAASAQSRRGTVRETEREREGEGGIASRNTASLCSISLIVIRGRMCENVAGKVPQRQKAERKGE